MAKRFLAIRDNCGKWPTHVVQLRENQSSTEVVEKFQRNLAAMTPGGLNGVTWSMLDAGDIVGALVDARRIGR